MEATFRSQTSLTLAPRRPVYGIDGNCGSDQPDDHSSDTVKTAEVPNRETEMEGLVTEAQVFLEKHRLDEAETVLRKVLNELPDGHRSKEQLGINTLIGLAEIYAKKGRSKRHDLMEWYRLMLLAATFQHEAMSLCQRISSQSFIALEDTKTRAAMQLSALEDCLMKKIHDNIRSTRASHGQSSDAGLHSGWLNYLQTYCCERSKNEEAKSGDTSMDDSSSLSSEQGEMSQITVQRKINFDQVQTAIMTLVKEITSDLRRRSWRKRVPEETLKRSISSEMVNRLSPDTNHSSSDLISMFNSAIIYEESDKCSDDQEEEEITPDTPNSPYSRVRSTLLKSYESYLHTPKSPLSKRASSSMSSINLKSGSLSGCSSQMRVSEQVLAISNLQSSVNRIKEYLPRSFSTIEPSDFMYNDLERSVSCPDDINDDNVFVDSSAAPYNMRGVLTVWKSYKRLQTPDNFRKYTLSSFEEVSPLTETSKFFQDLPSVEKNVIQDLYLDQQVMDANKMKSTLANIVAKVAEHLQRDKFINESLELFKFSLGLFQELPQHLVKPKTIGNVLKLVGVTKCEQGDIEGGIQLMEEAMTLFDAQVQDSYEVAEILYLMGNAYMNDQWKDASLFEHVMRLVKNDVDNDIQSDLGLSNLDHNDIADDMSDSDCSESGESYNVCTVEAMGCYKQALSMLNRLDKHCEQHIKLYVDVLTKLADCCIMISDYDQAVQYYEEALDFFSDTLASKCLLQNAHVLSMLGTANYLLANYPKAVTMYETASILQQHLSGIENKSFGRAFNLTMMGITFYTMKHYQKCILWCLRAHDAHQSIFTDIVTLSFLKRWFIVQTLYTLGFCYSTLNFYDEALKYLSKSKDLISNNVGRDSRQVIRILKTMADVHTTIDDHDSALNCYNQALKASQELGDEKTVTALQNQLLNKIAVVHVTNRQYSTAAEFLEKALDYQKNVQSSIHGDLIGMMHQLGATYTLSGDIDKAIECYKECIDTCQDLHGSNTSQVTQTLCNLALLYHVKACIQDEGTEVEEMLLKRADLCYQEALRLDPLSEVNVQYANFLYQQGQVADALLMMLPLLQRSFVFKNNWLVYNSVQQSVLPDHLQHELPDSEETVLQTDVFANFLALLCYKQLWLVRDAEDCLVNLCRIVHFSPLPINHSILGYSMMELHLLQEAAECFFFAAQLQENKDYAMLNILVCLYLSVYNILLKALRAHLDLHPIESCASDFREQVNQPSRNVESHELEIKASTDGMFDSGYSEMTFTKKPILEDDDSEVNSSTILAAIRKRMKTRVEEEDFSSDKVDILTAIRMEAANRYSSKLSKYYKEDSSFKTERSDYVNEEWTTYEETIDTPVEILDSLRSEWSTHEEMSADTPKAIIEYIKEDSLLDNKKAEPSYNANTWTTKGSEEAPEIIDRFRSHWTENHETDDEEEWVSEEVSVELPQEILLQIRLQQEEGSTIPWRTSSLSSNEDQGYSDFPKEVREFLDEQEVRLGMQEYVEQKNKEDISNKRTCQVSYNSWCSRRTSRDNDAWPSRTSPPTAVMNAINENNVTPHTQEIEGHEPNWESWQTVEETIETPPELLAYLVQQHH